MAFTSRTYTIRGLCPVILHNAQLSDPLNEYTRALKKVSGKRKKTDEDHEAMARIEFEGGLYLDDDGKVIMPSANIERMLLDAAKNFKLGKTIEKALWIEHDSIIDFPDQGRSVQELYSIPKYRCRASVRVTTSRTMRTRPQFPDWALEFTANFDPEILNPEQVDEITQTAGRIVGLGDWRPRHGRFEVTDIVAEK